MSSHPAKASAPITIAQDAYKKDGEALETNSDVKSNQAAQDTIFKTADALKRGK